MMLVCDYTCFSWGPMDIWRFRFSFSFLEVLGDGANQYAVSTTQGFCFFLKAPFFICLACIFVGEFDDFHIHG